MDDDAQPSWRALTAACLFVTAACLLVASCSSPPPSPPPAGETLLDLAWAFPTAAISTEVSLIEPGRPDARGYLVSGWSEDEKDGRGPYAWGVGTESVVEFFVAGPTDIVFGLWCAPFLFDGAPPQGLRLSLNGHFLDEIEVTGTGTALHEVAAPAETLVAGANRLVLSYAAHHRPTDVLADAEDERELAVMWRSIELRGLGTDRQPQTDALREVLTIPIGTEVVYYFDWSGPSELTAQDFTTKGDVELVVSFRGEVPASWTRTTTPRRGEILRLALDTQGSGVGRMALSARRRRGLGNFFRAWTDGEDDAVVLTLPTVRALGGKPATQPASVSKPERPNVLVYLVDTLRTDHLGVYGYDRPTSPELDRFAADAIVFDNAFAQTSWTRPSVVSILTGLRPWVHGVNRRFDALSQSVETLPEILSADGYETLAYVTNGNIGPDFALDQGFETYRYLRESPTRPAVHQLSHRVNERVFRWLDGRDSVRPFFLYVHTTDPHAPYYPPEPFRSRFAPQTDAEIGLMPSIHELIRATQRDDPPEGIRDDLIDLYDGEIASNDHHFGALLERLKELGLYDETLIIFLSDHGEAFFEHRTWGHGRSLYDEEIRMPFVVKLPGKEGAGTRSAVAVEQIDVVPTILEAAGLIPPARLEGRSVQASLSGGGRERAAFSILTLADWNVRSVFAHGFKLVLDDSVRRQRAPIQLYDLASARDETSTLR